ncbi:hypothetical protein ACHAPE_001567 [Trichoderma viride]
MSVSPLPSDTTIGQVDDAFFKDLEKAIEIMVGVAVKSHLDDSTQWVTFDRQPGFDESIFWCGIEDMHQYEDCSKGIESECKAYPTVMPNATISPCPHATDELRDSVEHNCFCFQIDDTMELFHKHFLRPRIEAVLSSGHTFPQGDPAKELSSTQMDALKYIVNIYNQRVHKSLLWTTINQKCNGLARFVTDMRRENIVSVADTMPTRVPWHTERVHAMLGWHGRSVDDCIAELKSAMKQASLHQISEDESLAELIFEGAVDFDGYGL